MKRYKITGTVAGIHVNLLIEEEVSPPEKSTTQPTLLPKDDDITVNLNGDPLPWEAEKKKKKRGRPKKEKHRSPLEDPITENQAKVLIVYAKMAPDVVHRMTKGEAGKLIADYRKEHPYNTKN